MAKGLPRSLTELYRQTAVLSLIIDPAEFGAAGDGVTDDRAKIQAAIDVAAAEGGGAVVFGEATYLVGGALILKSGVFLVTERASRIKLANGANTSVIEGENFQSLADGSSASGVQRWGIRGLVIDGNSANNPAPGAKAGHGVAVYGRDFHIDRVRICNTARRGLHTEYAPTGGTSPYNGNVHNLLTDNTGEEGWKNMVSDLHADNINARNAGVAADNSFDAVSLLKNVRGSNFNIWNSAANRHRYALNISADGTTVTNVHAETGATANIMVNASLCSVLGFLSYNVVGGYNVVVRGHRNILAGCMYPGTFNPNAVGLQIGQVGDGASGNMIRVTTLSHVAGAVDFTNSGGHNTVEAMCSQASGVVIVGVPNSNDRPVIRARGGVTFKEIVGGQAQGAVAIGDLCVASGAGAVAIGNAAQATQGNAHALGNNVAATDFNTFASGGRSRADLFGMRAHASGQFVTGGDAQAFDLQLFGQTADATPAEIFTNGSSLRATLGANTTWAFEVVVVGRQTNGAGVLHRRFNGTISRGAAANTTTFNGGAPTPESLVTPAGWDVALAANTSNGSLTVTVTGAAAQNINWVAHIRASRVQG